jgi:putative ABC transport system ATP-binding protein
VSPIIELSEVHRIYRTASTAVHAVRGVSLVVEPGEFLAIMGASGSGKSTLMNMLGCLDRPTRGVYRLNGIDVARLDGDQLAALRNRAIGFIFQGFNLLPRTSALENVELPIVYANPTPSRTAIRGRAAAALAQVGLADRMHHVSGELSGGQQQRVAIARALVLGPLLLLADEPTGNLDSHTSVEIMGVFQQLNDAGMTIVMVTHEPDIARYARRTVIMRDGRIVRDDRVTNRLFAATELSRAPPADPVTEPPRAPTAAVSSPAWGAPQPWPSRMRRRCAMNSMACAT